MSARHTPASPHPARHLRASGPQARVAAHNRTQPRTRWRMAAHSRIQPRQPARSPHATHTCGIAGTSPPRLDASAAEKRGFFRLCAKIRELSVIFGLHCANYTAENTNLRTLTVHHKCATISDRKAGADRNRRSAANFEGNRCSI